MAQQDTHARTLAEGRTEWNGRPYGSEGDEPSLGELLKRLSNDTGDLISQEITLAKAELRESANTAVKGASKLAIAGVLGLVGTIALTAFAVLGLADLIGGEYWVWALVVGAIELIVAAVIARGALKGMKQEGLKPDESIESLRESKSWAKEEARDLKRDITGSSNTAHAGR